MTVEEALHFFENVPASAGRWSIQRRGAVTSAWAAVHNPVRRRRSGLPGNRVEQEKHGKTIYILDNPTTGLHCRCAQTDGDTAQVSSDGYDANTVIDHTPSTIRFHFQNLIIIMKRHRLKVINK